MPHVLGGVDRFRHGADGDGLDQVLLGTSLYLVEQGVDALGHLGLGTLRFDLVPEAKDEGVEGIQLLRIRDIMHTIDKGAGFLTLGYPADGFRYRLVGQQHELLNQVIGLLRLLEVDTQWLSLLVEVELHLVAFKVDRTRCEAPLT